MSRTGLCGPALRHKPDMLEGTPTEAYAVAGVALAQSLGRSDYPAGEPLRNRSCDG
jgi:hypothetical protein